jgi:hypothetical protein
MNIPKQNNINKPLYKNPTPRLSWLGRFLFLWYEVCYLIDIQKIFCV